VSSRVVNSLASSSQACSRSGTQRGKFEALSLPESTAFYKIDSLLPVTLQVSQTGEAWGIRDAASMFLPILN